MRDIRFSHHNRDQQEFTDREVPSLERPGRQQPHSLILLSLVFAIAAAILLLVEAWGEKPLTPAALAVAFIGLTAIIAALLDVSFAGRRADKSQTISTSILRAEHLNHATRELGSRNAHLGRVGALYVLEAVALTSREAAESAANSLVNFIRESRRLDRSKKQKVGEGIPEDVQTAIAILGRLRTSGKLPLSAQIDLSSLNLARANLRGWDFSGVSFHHSVLDGSDLSNTNLAYTNLISCSLERVRAVNASFLGALMEQARFTSAVLVNVDFRHSILVRASFENARIHSSSFDHAGLAGANFDGAILRDTTFPMAVLSGASVDGSSNQINDETPLNCA